MLACDDEEYALYVEVEALEWFEFDQDEISSMVFKAKKMTYNKESRNLVTMERNQQ
jgi:hypothetical protein|tara:strand:+ start:923 stop:1090 length:168 start_codon:yes stop_codon:yes gene_type:complete